MLVKALCILLLGLVAVGVTTGYDGLPDDTYLWRDRQTYYYPTIEAKLEQIMMGKCVGHTERVCVKGSEADAPECREQFRVETLNMALDDSSFLKQMSIILAGVTSKKGVVIAFPPTKYMVETWRNIAPPRQMRMDAQLCKEPWKFPNPVLKGDKCRNINYMHNGAPRCQASYLRWICDHSSMGRDIKKANGFILPESDHAKADVPPTPYMVVAQDAYVTMCGQIVKDCGLILPNAGCMANDFNNRLLRGKLKECPLHRVQRMAGGSGSSDMRPGYNDRFSCNASSFVNVTRVEKLFIAGEVDDTHIYHVYLEVMPRIIQNLAFLKANPDIKILYGCDSRPSTKMTRVGLVMGLAGFRPLLKMVGIDPSRLVVHSDVYADVVYQPTEGGCQDPVFNTWSILRARDVLLSRAAELSGRQLLEYGAFWPTLKDTKRDPVPILVDKRPLMVLIKRSWGAVHTRNRRDNIRQWSETFAHNMVMAMRSAFPSFQVVLYSDKDEKLMECAHCQIDFIAKAKVLVGVHGAGLMHQLFMQPNGAVVEIGNYANDGRLLVGGGPFSRLAVLLAHNYMVHYPPYGSETVMTFRERVSSFNITNFVEHLDSFLRSISFV